MKINDKIYIISKFILFTLSNETFISPLQPFYGENSPSEVSNRDRGFARY